MGALMRAHDWSTCPLGPTHGWAPALRSTANLILQSKVAMFIAWGPDLAFLYNDAYAEMLGAKHPGALGRPFRDIWGEIWGDIEPLIDAALRGETTYHENLPLTVSRKGYDERAWFTFSYSPVFGDDGRVGGMYCAVTETTGQVLAEQALRESRERLEAVVAHASVGIAQVDLDGRFVLANDLQCRILGRTREELLAGGPRMLDITHPDDRPGNQELLRRMFLTGEPFAIDKRYLRPDGSAVWVSNHVSLSRDAEGRPRYVTALVQDITGRKEIEARQGFLLRLADALRPLRDAAEVQAEACRLLGGHLRAAQVGFGEVDAAQERVTVRRDWNDGRVPPVVGTWRMDDFGPAFAADLRRGATAAVADIALDPRTGAPGVVAAYAGIGARAVLAVPLVKGGRMAALLFVHNPEPRPWSPADVEVVEETCERLWAAVERAHAEEALRESEARWRGLFERMHEGFALYEMVYDAEGRAVDFRHLEVNAACERLTGLPASAIVGRLASEAVPGIERFWTDTYARVAETGEPVHFEHRVAALDRWFEVLAHRDGAGRVAVLFLNVTERKAAEARRDALVELGDRLRDLTEPAEIAHAAAEIIGRTLGGTRAACGIVDAARGVFRIERDWTDGRTPSIAGELRIADFWADLAAEHGPGEVVAVDDVERDPRTAARAAAHNAMDISAFLDAPLVEAGRVAAILFVHDDAPRAWTAEEVAFVRGLADRTWTALERARGEERRALLVNEVNHRAKNALAVVQAMLRLTKAADVPAFVRSVEGRVSALARAHTLLASREWAGSSLHDLVRGELAPFMAGRATVDGPAVTLPAVAAQPVAMAVHELATNAAKHGALSTPAGSVAVTWRTDGARLRIRWAESGGPPVAGPPMRSGFGSRLLDGTIRTQLRGTVERTWDASGLVCDVVVPLGEVHEGR